MGELLFLLAALTPILLLFALLGYLAERWEALEQRREERLADRHRRGADGAAGSGARISSGGFGDIKRRHKMPCCRRESETVKMSDCRYGDNCFACKKADCLMKGAKLQLSLRETDDPSVLDCSLGEKTIYAEMGRAILKWVYLMKKELKA